MKPEIQWRRTATKSKPVRVTEMGEMVSAKVEVLEQPAEEKSADPLQQCGPRASVDLKALRAKLIKLLPRDEGRQLSALFDRLEKNQTQNRANQAAWRVRQKKNGKA